MFQLKCKVAQCVFKGTKEKVGDHGQRSNEQEPQQQPNQALHKGRGKRFRCYKNYATRQQRELVVIMLPGRTREARIQACDKCNPTTRTTSHHAPRDAQGGTPFRRVTNATRQQELELASQLVGKFTLSNIFIIRVRYYPTSNFQVVEGQKTTPPLNYDQLPEGCKNLMSFGHPMHIFRRNFCYANGTCDHEK